MDAGPPEGALQSDPPPHPSMFAPDYAPEEISEISRRLRQDAGLPDEPISKVAHAPHSVVEKVKDKIA